LARKQFAAEVRSCFVVEITGPQQKRLAVIDAKTIADGAARLIVADRTAENGKAITRLAEIVAAPGPSEIRFRRSPLA
jgi:hypothetical protein